MKLVRGVGVALAVALWAACGRSGSGSDAGSPGDAGTSDAGLPSLTILTQRLQPAVIGQPYMDKLTARNGVPPLVWSLPNLPAGLSWLAIDPASGTLSGVPPAQPLGDQGLTVQVQDSAGGGRIVTRALVVQIAECVDGTSESCFTPSGAVCEQGLKACVDGGWGLCSPNQVSKDINACGSSCGVCGPGALACDGGQCVCGSGPACSGSTSICCPVSDGGFCTNLADPNACGSCGTVCDAGTRLNVARVCDGGSCSFPCVSSRYADCNGIVADGCEADFQSTSNCGFCFNACTWAPQGGWAICDAGNCDVACPAGTEDCSNKCVSLNDQNNCGGCGKVCPTNAPNTLGGACFDAGTCQLTCANGYGNCDTSLSNGCETNLLTDRNNCGGCGSLCPYDGGTADGGAYCVDGGCVFCTFCGTAGLCCAPQTCLAGSTCF